MLSRNWTFLREGGLSFVIFTKKQGRSSGNSGYEIQKICGWKIHSRTRTFNAEVHKSNIRVKRWHNKYENSELYWKTQNFCLNDLFTKSNRTKIQTYKVEERTSGTPCNLFNRHFWRCMLLRTKRQVFKILVFCNMRCFIMFVTAVSVLFLQN